MTLARGQIGALILFDTLPPAFHLAEPVIHRITRAEQTDLVVFLESISTFNNPWRPEDMGRCHGDSATSDAPTPAYGG